MSRFFSFCFTLFFLSILTFITGQLFTKKIHYCFIPCPDNNQFCKTITLDINGENKKQLMKNPCILNGWNILHILAFFFVTLLFPEYAILLFFVGLAWESLEILVGHENYLDILWNFIGISLGILIVNS